MIAHLSRVLFQQRLSRSVVLRIGGVQVLAVDQPSFSGVRAPLLIDLATYRPSGFSSNPAIT